MRAVAAGGNLAYWQADHQAAQSWYTQEREIARDLNYPAGEADAVFNLAHVRFVEVSDSDRMADLLRDARARYEAVGDARGVARCEWGLAALDMRLGRTAPGAPGFHELLPRFQELGGVQYLAMAATSMAWAAYAQGDLDGAAKWTTRGLIETYRSRDLATTTITLQLAAAVATVLGRPDAAAAR